MSPSPILVTRALTLWQPWAHAIVRGPKRIENRKWPPPTWIAGQYIAIHASAKRVKPLECALIEQSTGFHVDQGALAYSAIIGIARVTGFVTGSPSPWFMGPFGWVLGDVQAVEPIPCAGFQKLWNLKPATKRAIELALAAG